jgi:two-component system, chemotaxis family, chemotaxis protein CheY
MESHNPEHEAVQRTQRPVSREEGRAIPIGRERRRRILIVEDEEQVRKPMRLNLTKAGYDVVEVGNGADAIEFLKTEGNAGMVDTLLCDIRMPEVTGIDAILHVRTHYPSIPIVVLTGYPDVELAASLMEQGVLDYLIKPITREELLTVIERSVDHGKATR